MSTNKTKKGGSVMSDLNKLVVPFGLILAERSLSKMSKSEKKTTGKATVDKLEMNKKAAVGGKKTPKQSKGGAAKLTTEFNKLSSEIEHFLSKY